MVKIIKMEEFLLSHDEVAKSSNIGDNSEGNVPSFQVDFLKGSLKRYKGTYVIYHKGVLVGQSKNGPSLFKEAQRYYGNSNLALFKVPENPKDLCDVVEKALGRV